jgi:cobalt-zinc-cadmium efflux system protein
MHSHDHGPNIGSRAFALGIGLNVAFVAVEVVFGLRARSLALLSDAGHNLSDALCLGLSWGAAMLGSQAPTTRRTYGMRRASILASLVNAVLLLVAVGGIAWEAIQRLGRPEPVAGGVVMAVAAVGIVLNGLTALLFWSDRKRDINIRGAFVHMAADAVVSLGVVMAGFAIRRTGWFWLDPAVSLAIGVVIVWGTWGLLRQSFNLAMDAVPENVDAGAVEAYLRKIPGITAVHDLHVWAMSTTETALTVHLVKPDGRIDDTLQAQLCAELHDRFGIEHTTIQFECGDRDCHQAPAGVV